VHPQLEIPDKSKLTFYKTLPTIHVTIDEDDLFSKSRGIAVNPKGRGRKWERKADVYYYKDGELAFATSAGMRLHGGAHRYRRKINQKSFRFYFRRDYGKPAFLKREIDPEDDTAIKRLVLHISAKPKPFMNEISYDMSRLIGARALRTKPVMFYLNGKRIGLYYLSEQLSPQQFRKRLKKQPFYFYSDRKDSSQGVSNIAFNALTSYISQHPNLKLDDVRDVFNVDNYISHLFSLMYMGTTDWMQGAMFRLKGNEATWEWINWDMDRSFHFPRTLWEPTTPPLGENRGIELFLDPFKSHIRSTLFKKLIRDPAFQKLFTETVKDILNNKLTPENIAKIFAPYEAINEELGGIYSKDLNLMKNFISKRKDFIEKELAAFIPPLPQTAIPLALENPPLDFKRMGLNHFYLLTQNSLKKYILTNNEILLKEKTSISSQGKEFSSFDIYKNHFYLIDRKNKQLEKYSQSGQLVSQADLSFSKNPQAICVNSKLNELYLFEQNTVKAELPFYAMDAKTFKLKKKHSLKTSQDIKVQSVDCISRYRVFILEKDSQKQNFIRKVYFVRTPYTMKRMPLTESQDFFGLTTFAGNALTVSSDAIYPFDLKDLEADK
jgi:hypothetical protein